MQFCFVNVWFLVVACIRNSVSSYTLYRAQSLHTRHLIHHLHVQTLCSRSTVGAPPRFPARTSPMVHASRHPRGAWCSATGAAVASVACGHVLISGEARSGRSVWELSGSACDPRSSSQIRPMCCSTQSHQNGARQRKRQGWERAGDNYELEERARVHTALYERRSQLRTFFKVCVNTDEPYNTTTELAMNAHCGTTAQSHAVARPPLRGRFPGGPRQSRTRFVSSVALTAQPGGACLLLSSTHRSPAIRM